MKSELFAGEAEAEEMGGGKKRADAKKRGPKSSLVLDFPASVRGSFDWVSSGHA